MLCFSASSAIKSAISLSNEPCLARSTVIDLNPNEPVIIHLQLVSLDICKGSFNTLEEPSGRICVLDKTDAKNGVSKM